MLTIIFSNPLQFFTIILSILAELKVEFMAELDSNFETIKVE